MIRRLLQSARSIPPRAIAGRSALALTRRWNAAQEKRRDIALGSVSNDIPDGVLNVLCAPVPIDHLEPHTQWIDRMAALYTEHRFDLLG